MKFTRKLFVIARVSSTKTFRSEYLSLVRMERDFEISAAPFSDHIQIKGERSRQQGLSLGLRALQKPRLPDHQPLKPIQEAF